MNYTINQNCEGSTEGTIDGRFPRKQVDIIQVLGKSHSHNGDRHDETEGLLILHEKMSEILSVEGDRKNTFLSRKHLRYRSKCGTLDMLVGAALNYIVHAVQSQFGSGPAISLIKI